MGSRNVWDHGLLQFDGAEYQFPLTSGIYANHGTAMYQTWTKAGDDEIETDLGEHWPFGGTVRQRFELTDDASTVRMTVTADQDSMPAQMGWHPWFRRHLDRGDPLVLQFAAASVYETNDDLIPTGQLVDAPSGPWDETFIGVTQTPVLRWGDALTLSLTSNFVHWVVFTKPDHAVAIEPQSGAPNDLNRSPHALEPGESLSGWMMLSWREER